MRPEEPNKDKWSLADGAEEVLALLYNDPEGGAAGLRQLLQAGGYARETLEDAAIGLTDAGMHKAAKIVAEFAAVAPSEDSREVCPYDPNSINARAWHASAQHRRDARRQWRAERRRRKRDGSWLKPAGDR